MIDFEGCKYLIGADEAGRGSLAGPLVAAAVAVDRKLLEEIRGADDSKKLNPRKRIGILKKVFEKIACFSALSISPAEIDAIGIQNANRLALSLVVEDVAEKIRRIDSEASIAAIVDHYQIECAFPEVEVYSFDKADSKFDVVGLASIIAKVVRDSILSAAEEYHTRYSFSRHKGYGTEEHLKEIFSYGFCSIHRKSFKPVSQGKLFI
jgi:ribonuclease HII